MTYIYKSPLEERDGDFKVADGLITGATNANWDDAHAKRVDSWTFPLLYSSNVASISLTSSGIDHGGLAGLGDDDHAQYFADTLTGIRDRNYSTTGIITAGTLTDGTASLTGGVGTGYTLISPVIAGNFTWTGEDAVWDCTDNVKTVNIDTVNGFTFKASGRNFLNLDTDDNAIKFGNITDNQGYEFLGTGTASFGGNLDVTGNITTGQYIGDNGVGGDPQLIELDGALGIVTVGGDLEVDSHLGVSVSPSTTSKIVTGGELEPTINMTAWLNSTRLKPMAENLDVRSIGFTTVMADSSYDVSNLIGGYGNLVALGSYKGVCESVKVFSAEGTVNQSAFTGPTVTNWYDFYAANPVLVTTGFQPAGDLVNAYGLYIEDIVGGSSTNWSIYSLGGNMAHVGNVRIGDTTPPEYDLEVAGVVKSESGRIKNTTRVTTTYQILISDDQIFCDTDGGAFTATLPATPVDGQTYRIINTGASGEILTIDENGNPLFGVTTPVTIDDSEALIITYETTEGWW